MIDDAFPTFKRWLTTVELNRPRRWRIAPHWHVDSRAAQQLGLLRVLHMAAHRHDRPGPWVAALAEDHRGPYRWKLAKLALQLASGTPLADALEQTPGALSPEDALAVRFGVQSGTLPAVLATRLERDAEVFTQVQGRIRRTVWYILGVFLIGLLVTTFIYIKILPTFREILGDFYHQSPAALRALEACGDWVARYWYAVVLAGLAFGWFVFSKRGWRRFQTSWLPLFSRSAASLRGAEVLDLLAVTQQAGRPLPGAISTLARYHFDRRMRAQLLFARNEVEQGADFWESLAASGVLHDAEARALNAAPDQSSRIWTAQRLASARREEVARRLNVLIEFVQPAFVLLLAAGVLLVALGSLSSLVSLIESLS